ncbi:MAG: ABC transporter substrate-binding protein/permease [FCB group bacterium]|jgi:polar amino acid transport system substrate-binding protein
MMICSRFVSIKECLLFIVIFFALNHSSFSQQPVLRWAADAESGAPYAFQDPKNPSHLIGFEVDLIGAISKELGMKSQHVQNEWDGLIPGLERYDYECAINGIEITEDRAEVVNFSIPYYITFEQLVVRRSTTGVNTLSDLEGKPVGTLNSSLAERILKAKGGIDVRGYDDEDKSYKDLELGRIEAVLIDEPVVKYYAGWNPQLKLVGQPIGEISYGIAFRKNDTILLNKVNSIILKLKNNGKLREILERWNLWNIMMASYMKDTKESNVPHTQYNKYLEDKGQKIGIKGYINRYITFMPMILQAACVTLGISILSMVVAILVGLMVMLLRVYSPPPFSSLAVIFVEGIRGTPLLMQLYFIYYVLPQLGLSISPFLAAIVGLGLNYASAEAENYRAGLFSVPRGQMEAAISLGMTRNQALRHVILPQAIRLVIPPMTNDFIALLKDSSLVSVITMVELTKIYNQLAGLYYDYIGMGILVACVYLIIGLPFVKLAKRAEKYFAIDKRKIIKH